MLIYALFLASNTDDTAVFCFGTFVFIMLAFCGLLFWYLTAPHLRDRKNAKEQAEQARLKAKSEAWQAELRAKEAKLHAERDVEARSIFLKKYEQFSQSQDYGLLKQFVKKYSYRNYDEELSSSLFEQIPKLQELLENKEWKFSTDDLFQIVSWESEDQYKEAVYKKILASNPKNRREIIESYLNTYQTNNLTALAVLEFILKRDGLLENALTLKSDVEKVEKEIELKNFEKRLFEEESQIYLSDIDQVNGYEFEDFLKNLFSKMGYIVEQTRLSGDQGADLVVVKFGEKTVIQAKRYGAKIGNNAVQEIMAAISLYKAQKGMVITNNYFTNSAVELANANNIELIDRDDLEELINKHW